MLGLVELHFVPLCLFFEFFHLVEPLLKCLFVEMLLAVNLTL